MALIHCPECSKKISDKATSCPSCGFPIAMASVENSTTNSKSGTLQISKSRGTYIIIGLIFGAIGFHNFYSGHYIQGTIKIIFFLITLIMDLSTHFYSAFVLIATFINMWWT